MNKLLRRIADLHYSVEERKCCVTFSEMSTFKDDRQDYQNKEMLTSKFTPDDTGK
jgi:hypothetical protein